MIFFILVTIGILIAPIFTMGCILLYYDNTLLSILVFIFSLIRGNHILRLNTYIRQLQEEIKNLKKID